MSVLNPRSPIYWLLLVFTGFLMVAASGPGLFSPATFSDWILSWEKQGFSMLCHQMPDRSIWLSDAPMAVCSRCFGIYAAMFVTVVLAPFMPQAWLRNSLIFPFLFFAIGVNLADFLLDALTVWENTHTTRFLSGTLFGSSLILLTGTKQPRFTSKSSSNKK